MSYTGAGLYDDDAGADVRGRYRELVADGASGTDATDTLVAEWGSALDDHDEACAFWLALADTQWKVGRLEDRVRDRALTLIASGEDLERFGHDPRLLERRRRVLAKLEAQLGSPQRSPTRIRKPFRSTSPVGVGDLFWFALPTGRRILLRCVAVTGDERDNYPTVEVFDWEDRDPPIEPASLIPREAKSHAHGRWADMMCLVRYAGDPDPADRIRVVKTGTPITRRRHTTRHDGPVGRPGGGPGEHVRNGGGCSAMNDEAKVARVIRINTIAGSVIVGLVVLSAALVAVGGLTLDGRAIVSLVFGLVLASLMFLTARSAKQDLADPAGRERQFQSESLGWSAFLLVAGLVAVVGIVVWGVLG